MDIMFTIVPIFIGVIFVVLVVGIVFVLLYGLLQWQYNNQQPIKQVAARVVTKRTQVSGHENTSTYYYCTFEMKDGTRHEFRVAGKEYGQKSGRGHGHAHLSRDTLSHLLFRHLNP